MNKSVLTLIQADQPEKWQESLADLITEPKELAEILGLDLQSCPPGLRAATAFPMKVPRPFAARMQAGNWQDPLLRQVWPTQDEETEERELLRDPLQEARFNVQPGLLQKYAGRVLLTAAPHCAVHCRYCFRRHFNYEANTPGRSRWEHALQHIADDDSIEEVILSGGDPLAASNSYLAWLIDRLNDIPHVVTLRLHSRLPIVIPQRIDTALRQLLNNWRGNCVVVIHCNHSQEFDGEVSHALQLLREDGHTLLNQSVVLKGINDSEQALVDLSRVLFDNGVLPYYLHLPDKVAGTSHFLVSEARATALLRAMQARLPGYLVPTLVKEEPGAPGKTRLG